METKVIFPICDYRKFLGSTGYQLTKPSWIMPERHRDFVRALGGIKSAEADCKISLKGLSGWVVEPFVCDARRGPSFHNMPTMVSGLNRIQWKVKNRLLYFDGNCSSRVEYHLYSNLSNIPSVQDIDVINKFLCDLRLKIKIHEGEKFTGFEEVDFGRSGLLHARSIVSRTISKDGFKNVEEIGKFVKFLKPAIVHIVNFDEKLNIGNKYIKVQNNRTSYIDVYHERIRVFGNIDIPIWVICKKKKVPERDVRDLSLYLRRLHCEYECLKRLLIELEKDRIPLDGEHLSVEFEEYVEELLSRINSAEKNLMRKGRFSPEVELDSPSMVDLAAVSIHELNPTLHQQIKVAIEKSKFHLTSRKKKTKKFLQAQMSRVKSVGDQVIILNDNSFIQFNQQSSGVEIMVDNSQTVKNSKNVVLNRGRNAQVDIDKSFNDAQELIQDLELVQAVTNLKILIDRAIEKDDVNSPENLARDFEELSKEVTSANPRVEKIKFSAKMIASSIKETSTVISSISKAITDVSDFFV